MNTLRFVHLGRIGYRQALEIQTELFRKRRLGAIPDTIVCVEHCPSVYTVGQRAVGIEDLKPEVVSLIEKAGLEVEREHRVSKTAEGVLRIAKQKPYQVYTTPSGTEIEIARVQRGGRATWHGMGQLTVYPICNFKELRAKSSFVARSPGLVHWWVRALEASIIRFLHSQGVQAWSCNDVGVWIGGPVDPSITPDFQMPVISEEGRVATTYGAQRKVAAVGVQMKQYCSMHGLSVNINPDLSEYAGIVPCGLDASVTSLRNELPQNTLTVDSAVGPFIKAFVETLQPKSPLDVVEHPPEHFFELLS
eukprot:TRINITY_DN31447_c0_g1_i1.p1 TRINITY_DN31447_c0_g1~~TRINITY_DN31447_c0_g1_i1.p1  ORF type:complete len:322 (+),score=56.83 TRINITY_DN31447_c0_g1_i1:50-967(+)